MYTCLIVLDMTRQDNERSRTQDVLLIVVYAVLYLVTLISWYKVSFMTVNILTFVCIWSRCTFGWM